MPETKFCLSGHDRPAWDFGRDMSRPDRLSAYCKPCCRNRTRERREKMKWGSDVYSLVESEAAIERNQEKRRREAEIAKQLRTEGREPVDTALPLASIAGQALFGRAPRRFKPAWWAE